MAPRDNARERVTPTVCPNASAVPPVATVPVPEPAEALMILEISDAMSHSIITSARGARGKNAEIVFYFLDVAICGFRFVIGRDANATAQIIVLQSSIGPADF